MSKHTSLKGDQYTFVIFVVGRKILLHIMSDGHNSWI
jgi:hypothetical protein